MLSLHLKKKKKTLDTLVSGHELGPTFFGVHWVPNSNSCHEPLQP